MSDNQIKQPRIAWLVPCHNEEQTVAKVVSDIREHAPDTEVYVYDNNSTDRTAELAAEAGAVVRKEPRQGKGYVVRRMLEEVDADIYILIDGDDTYSVAHWRELVAPLAENQADMVVGLRLTEFAAGSFRPLHLIGNKLLCLLINNMFRIKVGDLLSGYRALDRGLAKGIALNARGFEVETELTIQALENHFVIREVVSPYKARPEGSLSKISTLRDGFIILFSMIRLLKDYKPLTFFGLTSMLIWSCALGFHLGGLPESYTLTAVIVGVLALLTGVVLNAISQRAKELGQLLRKHD